MSNRSARDRLFSLACQDMPVTSEEVNEAIDAFAQEQAQKALAAKVRQPEGEVERHLNWALDELAMEIGPHRRCDMEEAHTSHQWTKGGITYLCKTVVLNHG